MTILQITPRNDARQNIRRTTVTALSIEKYGQKIEAVLERKKVDPKRLAKMLEKFNLKVSSDPRGAEALKLVQKKIVRHAVRSGMHEEIALTGRPNAKYEATFGPKS
jgi:hypothetical protein